MTLREFYLQRLRAEFPVFMKVFKALPKDRLNYKPHDKSPSAEQLVWTITGEFKACLDIVSDGNAEWKTDPAPPLDEMLSKFEQWSNELIEGVVKMEEAAWEKPAPFLYQGKVVSERPAGQFIWFVMFDAIHHRGQLAAYLRPMGGKVPSIYGPSADEP